MKEKCILNVGLIGIIEFWQKLRCISPVISGW
uniref:Uncharacterized protein n=1 Tax=Arundo donax TaxID=35708 RepID=A0A0A9FUV8_ARUDO